MVFQYTKHKIDAAVIKKKNKAGMFGSKPLKRQISIIDFNINILPLNSMLKAWPMLIPWLGTSLAMHDLT